MSKVVKVLWFLFLLMLVVFAVTTFVADVYVSWCVFSVVAVVWWIAIIATVIYIILRAK